MQFFLLEVEYRCELGDIFLYARHTELYSTYYYTIGGTLEEKKTKNHPSNCIMTCGLPFRIPRISRQLGTL